MRNRVVEKTDEAVRLYLAGDLQSAEKIYKQLLRHDANNHNVLRLLGLLKNKRGDKDSAKRLIIKAIGIDSTIPAYHNNLGEIYRSEKNYDDAILSYSRAISLNTQYSQAYNNLGCAQFEIGRYEESIDSFNSAIANNSSYSEAYSNRGNALKEVCQLDSALESYNLSIKNNPGWSVPYNNRGVLLQDIGKKEDALESYDKAISIDPYYAEAYSNRGNVLGELGFLERAVDSYKQAIHSRSDYLDAYSNLCELYEKHNMASEMQNVILRWEKLLSEDDSNIQYRKAQLASMEKRYEDACNHLEIIDHERISPNIQLGYSELLAKTYDKLGLFSSAFVQFEATNNVVRNSPIADQVSGQRYFDRVLRSRMEWESSGEIRWPDAQILDGNINTPVFLVGFPRSGTTLLDTIIMSHSDVIVVEEKPMVASMRSLLDNSASPDYLTGLENEQIDKLRKVYFEELSFHVSHDDLHKLIVDKLPLNITDVGLIHRVFPESRFILSLRHPYDCVLSCFMQNFKLNDAMANFLTLTQAAKLYDEVMRLWDCYNDALDIEFIELKYESLVQDMRGTVNPLLSFLSMEWDDNLLNYQQTAISRGKINTPSYNQVTQALYTQASGRWKNYQDQINEIVPLLEPWADRFGYSTSL